MAERLDKIGKGKRIEIDETHATASTNLLDTPDISNQLLTIFSSLAG